MSLNVSIDGGSIYQQTGQRQQDPSLPEDVIAFSDRFFRQSWTHDHPPRPGSVRLVPPPRIEAALREDYAAMQEMFWNDAPSFDTLLAELRRLESDINAER